MGKIKGQAEYNKFLSGSPLSRKEAILAQCYMCNGFEESNVDCEGKSCPLYQFSPYKGKKTGKLLEQEEMVIQAEKMQP